MAGTQVLVGMGEIQTVQDETEICVLGVGSGVVVAAYDSHKSVGACAHFILPDPPPNFDSLRPGKYAGLGVFEVLRQMQELGAGEASIKVALIGGAGMTHVAGSSSNEIIDLGSRNVKATLTALGKAGLNCVAEDVGGQLGRTISFCGKSGKVRVRKGIEGERVLCILKG